jgi:ABC-2 type transport system permease protein
MSFAISMVDSVVFLVFFYFLSKIVGKEEASDLVRYGGNYLAFVVIGLAFARYFQLTLKMFADSVREAQQSGCLEAMMSSQTDSLSIVLMSSFYGLISGAVQLLLILIAGSLILGVDFSQMNVLATIMVFILSILSFVAFGVLSAGFILWLKRGDPFTWILGGVGSMVGGAYFPVQVLPSWLQKISFLIPITYSLDALRLTMLRGYSVRMVARPLLILGLMATVLLPISLTVFAAMVRKGRKEGTLTQY